MTTWTAGGPAPAKINLTLEVLGRRDDGYHELRTILQTLSLADRVSIAPASGDSDELTLDGPYAALTPATGDNLVLRCLAALRAAGLPVPPLAVRLDKHIPPAGGLGGGASDAATVLRLVGRALPQADEAALVRVANTIGSDEAALFLGGTVLAEGRGERVAALPNLQPHGVVLFVPPEQVERKTARVFAARSQAGAWDDGSATAAMIERLQRGDRLDAADLCNTFEPVIDAVAPQAAALRAALEVRLGEPVRLAGAGPVLFWIGVPERGESVAARASGLDCSVVVTTTAASCWRS